MFDISWSELLILAVVTLIFVGPKDLPRFLAFVGKWAGVAKRHAAEFRQVFDQAMREAELDQMRREVEEMQANIERTVRDADRKTAEAAAAAEAPPKTEVAEAPAAADAMPSIQPPAAWAATVAASEPAAAEPAPTPDNYRPGPEVVSIEPETREPALQPASTVPDRHQGAP